MNNYAWMSPRPLAPTAASYWLWHPATLPCCLPASRSLCLSSCSMSTSKVHLQQSDLIISQEKKISAVPRPQQTQQSFVMDRPDLGKKFKGADITKIDIYCSFTVGSVNTWLLNPVTILCLGCGPCLTTHDNALPCILFII